MIKGSFRDGKSGRISILTHPSDSRMYARVVVEGEVRAGDPIRGAAASGRNRPRRSSTCSTSSTASSARPGSRCGGPRRRPATTSGSSTTATLSAAPAPDLPGSGLQPGVRAAPDPDRDRRRSSTSIATRGPRAGSSTRLEEPPCRAAVADGPSASTPPRSRSCSPWRRLRVQGLAIRPVGRAQATSRRGSRLFIAGFDDRAADRRGVASVRTAGRPGPRLPSGPGASSTVASWPSPRRRPTVESHGSAVAACSRKHAAAASSEP